MASCQRPYPSEAIVAIAGHPRALLTAAPDSKVRLVHDLFDAGETALCFHGVPGAARGPSLILILGANSVSIQLFGVPVTLGR